METTPSSRSSPVSAVLWRAPPQSFRLGDLYGAHCRAISEGRGDFIDSASMMMEYGHTLYTVTGPAENIKITTPSDYYMFKSFVEAQENKQIFGY